MWKMTYKQPSLLFIHITPMPYLPAQTIPVLRPKLCDAASLLPYLRQIDTQRTYSNNGPLVNAFEQRMAALFSITPEQLVMVTNGTLGLTVALQALDIPRGSLCLAPSWTFTATPAAIVAAGLEPVFMDVCKTRQTITPQLAKAALAELTKPVGAVMAVSAFGMPLDVAAWDQFTDETGIPVVVDAAAAFDSFANGMMQAARTPVMISLHATKIFGIGEGGLLLTSNTALAARMREVASFGFAGNRESQRTAINAKPSEYSAAVGLAMLDGWATQREGWARVHRRYREILSEHGIACWAQDGCVTSTCNIIAPNRALALKQRLLAKHIDTRRWWEDGCHTQAAYHHLTVAGDLANTRYLSQAMLGLPMAWDLSEETLRYIGDTLISEWELR